MWSIHQKTALFCPKKKDFIRGRIIFKIDMPIKISIIPSNWISISTIVISYTANGYLFNSYLF